MKVLPVKLPDVGEGVTEAELVEWHVSVGDIVKEDDVIAAVMTDKATVEIPSLFDGKVVERTGEVGEILPIGTALVLIETNADEADQEPAADPEAGDTKYSAAPATTQRPSAKAPDQERGALENSAQRRSSASARYPPRSEGAPILASPALRKRAREAGIDLRQVPGTGPAGRITSGDLDAFFDRGPEPQPGRSRQRRDGTGKIPVIGMRRKIAERMSEANARIPHITVIEEVDMTAVESLRGTLNETRGERPKLTLLPILCAALCRAFGEHPEMNAHYLDEEDVVLRHAAIHIGIATMTGSGLMVPVIRHAEALGLFEAAAEILRLSEAARDGSATRTELSGSTFTISSLGPLGAIATTPIINRPEVAILGVNKIEMRPHWDGKQFVPRQKMNISASFDHRVIDGWDAATFVQKLKRLLETPALIFIED